MARKRIGKKGSLTDVFFWTLVMTFFAVSTLFGFKIVSEINDQIQGMSDIPQIGKDASAELTNLYPTTIDNSFLFLGIGLSLVIILLATLVLIHPIFIPIYILGLVFYIFLSGIMSNLFQEMAANSNLVEVANQLTFISLVMNYLPLFTAFVGFLLMIVLYKVRRSVNVE